MYNTLINTFFHDFLTFFNGYRKKRKIHIYVVKDEKKLHDTVDKSSSEQRFVNRMRLPLLCEKYGAIPLVLVGLTAGRQAMQAGSQTKYRLI